MAHRNEPREHRLGWGLIIGGTALWALFAAYLIWWGAQSGMAMGSMTTYIFPIAATIVICWGAVKLRDQHPSEEDEIDVDDMPHDWHEDRAA